MYKYREIYSDIKRDILTNHYRAGTLLPTQEFFAEKYNVSRITLKKALTLLENDGLIFSKQGSGTYIRPNIDNSTSELLPLDLPVGVTYSHRDQSIESHLLFFDARLPYKEEQQYLLLNKTDPVYEFKRVRLINKEIYSYEHVVMPVYIASLTEEILQGSIYDYLGKEVKLQLVDARRILFADYATEEISNALNIDLDSPILVIEQIGYDQKGRPFEFSKSYFLPEKSKFVLDIHLKKT
ncbi:GntR family transcriptional regulator [Enterococcus hirae]|uniref:GntR family transcriptional regulator n=1 Tax=Enterococcus hirae TaxID=1354 RepID=UPI00159CA3EC|nr:GntR family transcriptional regulator [Enterococcus hirae]MBA5270733.1 GntR family transcriptional regulator [Enterococcus hirae]NVM00683.1 GntR family transcriptional regulator [Enterococcus hirae]